MPTRLRPLPYDRAEAVRHLAAADPVLARVMERNGPFTLELHQLSSPFAALARSITYQQLTGRAAATIHGRMVDLFRPARVLRPELILEAPEHRLRSAGLSRSKILALRDLAARTLDGTVPTLARLARMSDAEIIERLTVIRGIGPWTVEMLLIFRLGRPDVLPVTDYGVRKGFARAYRKRKLPEPRALGQFGRRWAPYRSVAAWYLWREVEREEGGE